MDDKELPECVELNVHTKHNELDIKSKTPAQLKTQSFPQYDGVSDKIKHIDQKLYTVEKKKKDEHILNTQFATHTDEMSTRQILLFLMNNLSKVNFMTQKVMKFTIVFLRHYVTVMHCGYQGVGIVAN